MVMGTGMVTATVRRPRLEQKMVGVFTWTQAIRLSYILGLVAVAYLAFDHTRSELFAAETSRQERDLTALLQAFETGVSIDPTTTDIARTALSSDALDSHSLTRVWLASVDKGGDPRSPVLLSLAGQVSRRSLSYLAAELMTAAQNEDVREVVRAFDRMASISPAMRARLAELVVPLLDHLEGERLLSQYHSRPWFTQFIATAIRQPDRLTRVANFLNRTPISDPKQRSEYFLLVSSKFLNANRGFEAQNFAQTFGRVTDRELNGFKFEAASPMLEKSLLSWQFRNTNAQPVNEGNGILRFPITSDTGPGPIAERMFAFRPGRYRIELEAEFVGQAADASLSWSLHCGTVPIRQNSQFKEISQSNRFMVISEFETSVQCEGYLLSLKFIGPSGSFDRLELIAGRRMKLSHLKD